VSKPLRDKNGKIKGRWASLLSVATGNMVDTADGGLINGLFPVIRASLHMNLETLGLFSSISRVARMLFGPLWAMAADHFNRKLIMFLVTGVWGFWTILAGFAQNTTQLLILYAIGAIGVVATEPIANSLVADMFPHEERGKAFGVLRSIGGVGLVVFAPIIGQFAKWADGWRWGMVLMGSLSVISGIGILIFLKDPGRGACDKGEVETPVFHWRDLGLIFRIPTVMLTGISLFMVTSLVLVSFAVTFLVDIRGFTTTNGTWVLAFFGVGFILSSIVGGMVGDRFERISPKYGRVFLMQIYLLAFAVVSYLAFQIPWPTHAHYYLVFFAFGLVSSIGFSGAVLPMLSAVVPANLRSSAFGFLFSFLQGGITAIMSYVVGRLSDHLGLLQVLFWVGTAPYLFNFVFWFVFYRFYPRDVIHSNHSLSANGCAVEEERADSTSTKVGTGSEADSLK